MVRKKFMFMTLVFITALLGFTYFLYSGKPISDGNIVLDIQNRVNRELNEKKGIANVDINVKVELIEEVLNNRFIVYSFMNPLVGYRHAGYIVYEISKNRKFKAIDFGWNSSSFNTVRINVSQNGKSNECLMVYGMNKNNKKQIYKYISGINERIEEFTGDFFLRRYALDGNAISFTNLNP